MSEERQKARNQVIAERVTPLAARVAERVGCELAYVKYVFEGGFWVLRVVIDRDGGVNVDQCAKVSRQLSAILDVEDFIVPSESRKVYRKALVEEIGLITLQEINALPSARAAGGAGGQ